MPDQDDTSADTTAQGEQQTQQAEPTVEELKAQLAQASEKGLKLERALTRQSTELGQYRKMADQALLRETTGGKNGAEKPDFFVEPDKAVSAAIESHPLVKQIVQNAAALQQERFTTTMESVVPNYMSVTKSDEFIKWVAQDPIRSELYVRADRDADVAAGKSLLSTWKERDALQKTLTETTQQQAQTDLKAVKATTGTSGTTGKKVYSRLDLMRLRTSDPEKYNALNVQQLYAEGRVK